jgi:hypothetical protein
MPQVSGCVAAVCAFSLGGGLFKGLLGERFFPPANAHHPGACSPLPHTPAIGLSAGCRFPARLHQENRRWPKGKGGEVGQLGKIEGYRLALREERALGWRQGRAGHGPEGCGRRILRGRHAGGLVAVAAAALLALSLGLCFVLCVCRVSCAEWSANTWSRGACRRSWRRRRCGRLAAAGIFCSQGRRLACASWQTAGKTVNTVRSTARLFRG